MTLKFSSLFGHLNPIDGLLFIAYSDSPVSGLSAGAGHISLALLVRKPQLGDFLPPRPDISVFDRFT